MKSRLPVYPLFNHKLGARLLISASLTLGAATAAHADTLAYDGFGVGGGGYTNGAGISGNGNGTGWAGAWTGGSQYATVTGSIAPSSVVSEDGMVTFGDGTASQALGRQYNASFSASGLTEGWASWTIQRNNSERDLRLNPFANNTNGQGQYMGLYAPRASSFLEANIRYGSSSEVAVGTSFEMTLGTSYFMVAQALLNSSGTPDTFNVWIFESSSYTGAALGAPTISVSHDSDHTFDSWSMTDQNPQGNTANVIYDEFRLGESFADVSGVVPEPSTYALLAGVACVGVAFLRRRK